LSSILFFAYPKKRENKRQTTEQPGTYRISELPPNVLVTVRLSTTGLAQAKRLKEGKSVEVRANE